MPDAPWYSLGHHPWRQGCREQHDDGSAFGALVCANVADGHEGPHWDPVLGVYWHPDADPWERHAEPDDDDPRRARC